MVKNNKGVTLTELLIVIVVMGIIAAFSVPAVGSIIENTKKDAVLADALTIESAAKLYCSSNSCTTTQSLSKTELATYIQGLDVAATPATAAKYVDDYTAVLGSGDWTVTLNAGGLSEYEFSGVPSQSSRSDVDDK